MLRFYFFLLFIGVSYQSFSQATDIINVTRKNGRHLKSFFAGSSITFQTTRGNYVNGMIKSIKNDSLFVKTYVMGRYMTEYGFTVLDTANVYTTGFSYKEILHIKLDTKKSFFRKNLGGLLIAGGAAYTALNVINRAASKEPIADKENLKNLGTAGAAIGLGLLINKIFPATRFSRKRDKINYVNMQVVK
jgi:hypothetical protein